MRKGRKSVTQSSSREVRLGAVLGIGACIVKPRPVIFLLCKALHGCHLGFQEGFCL